jgi:hypothetical protein
LLELIAEKVNAATGCGLLFAFNLAKIGYTDIKIKK